MTWQDTLILISNFGILLAIMPLFFATVFGVKTIEVSLVATGFITSFFLSLISVAIISLGALWGGGITLVVAVVWLIIGMAALKRSKKNENRKG